MSEMQPMETRERPRRYTALRSTLIGYGVLAFTLFPPTRTLMLWGVGVQIAVIVLRQLIERRVSDPATAGTALMVLELIGDGVTVALFAIATLGGIMHLGDQV
jgi:ABC-type enterochelin transport system permease subunit